MTDLKALADAWPKAVDDEFSFIVNWPLMRSAHAAAVYRALGHDIPRKYEAEVAFLTHRFIGLWLDHGAGWREVAEAEMQRGKAACLRAKEEE